MEHVITVFKYTILGSILGYIWVEYQKFQHELDKAVEKVYLDCNSRLGDVSSHLMTTYINQANQIDHYRYREPTIRLNSVNKDFNASNDSLVECAAKYTLSDSGLAREGLTLVFVYDVKYRIFIKGDEVHFELYDGKVVDSKQLMSPEYELQAQRQRFRDMELAIALDAVRNLPR
jgi:hypothetical protein